MVLANETSAITGMDYVEVIELAGLEEEFEKAWDARVQEDRVEAGLASVSEDKLVKKTLEEADGLWAFAMSSHPVRYYIIPIEENN